MRIRILSSAAVLAIISTQALSDFEECHCIDKQNNTIVSERPEVQDANSCNNFCKLQSTRSGVEYIPDTTGGTGALPFELKLECSQGPAPAGSYQGSKVFLDRTPNPVRFYKGSGRSCIYLDKNVKVSKIYCHLTNDWGGDNYWCTYPGKPGERAEDFCKIYSEDARAWPDGIKSGTVAAFGGRNVICVSATNWSNWMNRHFQIMAK